MSDPHSDPSGDFPKPPPDGGWSGLPDVDWYQPQAQAPPQPPSGAGYGYGSYPGQAYGRAPLVNKPKSNLVSGILVTVLCCLPFGIVSIVYAAQVEAKWNAGDWRGAERASRSAKNWALAGVICGLVFSVVYVLIVLGSASNSTTVGY